jgi:putative MFS transporter
VVEGFDTNVANVVLPYVGDTFTAGGQRSCAHAQALIALGAVAAYFTIQSADRWGRRPVLLAAVVAFSGLSLATALAAGPAAVCHPAVPRQDCPRHAAHDRVRAAQRVDARDAPRTRERHARSLCERRRRACRRCCSHRSFPPGTDWRGLFVLGRPAIAGLPLLWRWVGESPAFLLGRQQGRVSQSLARQLGRLLAPDLRRRFLSVSGLWFVINFWVGATMFLFSFYAVRERGWTADDLRRLAPFGLICAFVGSTLPPDALMDAIGAPTAAAVLLVLGGIATLVTFKAESFVVVAAGWVCLQALQGILADRYTLTTELFPTEVRASANGLAHNLLGRWGQVAGPFAVNLVALELGTTVVRSPPLACVNLLALPLLRWGLPETRQAELSERDARALSK